VITEATLKLTPLAEAKRTLRSLYQDMDGAARAVSRIMAQPVTPCALEFMDGQALTMIRGYAGNALPDNAGALLMIEVDGPEACIDDAARTVLEAARGEGCLEAVLAETPEEVAALWTLRKALSPALRTVAPKKINEDVVVPVSRIPALIEGIGELSRRFGITIVNFGHAGNGNIHVNLLIDPDDKRQMANAEACLSELFDLVLRLEGTLSGEHGIGMVKRPYVARELDPVALELMQQLKRQFDPLGLLNPGKAIPD
jgi:D-lactate dehydrogenase